MMLWRHGDSRDRDYGIIVMIMFIDYGVIAIDYGVIVMIYYQSRLCPLIMVS